MIFVSWLQFSTSAKRILNKPVQNEILSDEALLRRCKQEIAKLKKQLSEVSVTCVETFLCVGNLYLPYLFVYRPHFWYHKIAAKSECVLYTGQTKREGNIWHNLGGKYNNIVFQQ